MSISVEGRQLLKSIYQNLADAALKPDTPEYDKFYQEIYTLPGVEDPVEFLRTHIEFSAPESMQLFSGFRGSGKTTELFRLQKQLAEEGYVVLYADAIHYINPTEEIDISDLLIVLAGAFSDALATWAASLQAQVRLTEETYWERLKNFLTRISASLTEIEGSVEASSPAAEVLGGLKAGLNLKLALRESPSFRQSVQRVLQTRIGELRNTVHEFFQDGVKEIKRVWGDEKEVVFIFDSLDQIRGSLSNEESVLRSVERVFAQHLNLLKLPILHAVYTVPPWLKFVIKGHDIYMLQSIKLWNNDSERTRSEPGWNALREMVLKRVGIDGCRKLFACETEKPFTASDDLIAVCGGDFRILLRLLRETILRARTLPVAPEVLESAVTSVRNDFSSLSVEDALWLAQIGESRATALPDSSPKSINSLTRFLDTHLVLYLTNGSDWYDTHPLIREEVERIVRQQQSKRRTTPPATV